MEYLNKDELRRLFTVAYKHNKRHHLSLVVAFWHGLRVSEVVSLTGAQIFAGQVTVRRLKGSKVTTQPIHVDSDPLFDESPLLALSGTDRLFPWTKQNSDQFIKKYAIEAGLMAEEGSRKIHFHMLKHSCAMVLWDATKNLGQIQSYLGHKAASSTLCYLYESDKRKAEEAMAGVRI